MSESRVFCDECGETARFLVFAAYEQAEATHPLVARYPLPQWRACEAHLAHGIVRDDAAPLSSREWVVRAITLGAEA